MIFIMNILSFIPELLYFGLFASVSFFIIENQVNIRLVNIVLGVNSMLTFAVLNGGFFLDRLSNYGK